MKCRTCGSAMVVDHRESGQLATAIWHSCPLCNTRRLTSEPDRQVKHRSYGEGQDVDDDSVSSVRQAAFSAHYS